MLCVGIPSSVAHCALTFSFQELLSHSLPNFVCSICRVLLISWLPSQGEFIWGKKCKIDAFLKKSSSILWACFRQIRYILEVSVESLILSWPWRPMGLLSQFSYLLCHNFTHICLMLFAFMWWLIGMLIMWALWNELQWVWWRQMIPLP